MSHTASSSGYRIAMLLVLGLIPVGIAAAPLSMTLDPTSTDVKLAFGETKNWTVSASAATCTSDVTYSLKKAPKHGSMILDADFSINGQFEYTSDDTGNGKLGVAKETIHLEARCNQASASTTPAGMGAGMGVGAGMGMGMGAGTVVGKGSVKIKVSDSGATCGGSGAGMVVFDNTATPHIAAIKSNLKLYTGCSKGNSTIETGTGGNSINIEDFHVLNRDIDATPDKLMLTIGAEAPEVIDQMITTSDKQEFFKNGKHLFELNRLRSTADWLSGATSGVANISPDADVATSAYGTMTLKQFITHIAAGDTLYGIVRVKIGLQMGQRSNCDSNCTVNALGETVSAADIFGFCDSNASAGLCSATECAPGKDFTDLAYGTTVCGISIPGDAKIRVKGSLMFDFVDHENPNIDVPLAALPYAPRELYFKVIMPIMVNWAHDKNLNGNLPDGAMDNMSKVLAVSNGKSSGELTPTINYSDIPLESKDAYQNQTGTALTGTIFNGLSYADKYHMLMPSGYADGWAEAFNKLNITTAMWADLPPSSCVNSLLAPCSSYGISSIVGRDLVANDFRSSSFEDIPTYLYSGGLIDMHSHVNISGLVYVPQGMELEAKDNGIAGQSIATQQYISGSIVVRDGFYIQANSSEASGTVISADPRSYSSAKRHVSSATAPVFTGEKGGPGASLGSSVQGSSGGGGSTDENSPCVGCSTTSSSGGGITTTVPAGRRLWMEIRPSEQQVPAL